jgi:cobalt-precorrin-7 (C5)-methyltransferase
MRVYLVGVGPGNKEYITERVKNIINSSDIIIGYRFTLNTIKDLINGKDVRYITLKDQIDVYKQVLNEIKHTNKICVIPFTGDANFSESEIIDLLREIFGDDNIIIEPGISSIQIAAARSKIPLDKSIIITFHITGSIENEKAKLLNEIMNKMNIILLPRPWDFMPKDIINFLIENNIKVEEYNVEIYERLTLENETITRCRLDKIPNKEYSDLTVMVIKPT